MQAALPPLPAMIDIMSVWAQNERPAAQWDGSIQNHLHRNLAAEFGVVGDPTHISMENANLTTALTDIMYASWTMVSNGYSTSGRCIPSQYQNKLDSQAAFSCVNSRYGEYIACHPSSPWGVGTSRRPGNRRSTAVFTCGPLLRSACGDHGTGAFRHFQPDCLTVLPAYGTNLVLFAT